VSLSEAERTRGRAFAAQLSMRVLSRAWQMLLKGLPKCMNPVGRLAAAEMVLVRIAYAADLPTPDEVVRSLSENVSVRPQAAVAARPSLRAMRPDMRTPRGSPRLGGGGVTAADR
jgi:DNA polymerase-3 subunit gamma/tau